MVSNALPAIFIMGTTATGKTDAAAALADAFATDIISVDSSLVYQSMNIGTAKPEQDFLRKYPHALVDIKHPDDTYSVADFYQDAQGLVAQARKNNRLPVLVGGTHFYFSALEHGLPDLPVADAGLRQNISQRAEQYGWPNLHQQLSQLDPQRAANIHPQDAQRIQRALEIVLSSGKTMTELQTSRKQPLAAPVLKIALAFSDRAQLHRRIALRFEQMLERGLQQEVEGLIASGVKRQANSMKMIGYRQMLEFLQGDLTFDAMRNKGIAATRQLAKRQLTWLRNQSNVVWWVDIGLEQQDYTPFVNMVRQFVRLYSPCWL